jgi:flagellar M-ring protein FliF
LGTLLFGALVLMGAVRPALKVLAETPAVHHVTPAATLDALESDQPERPLLTGPSAASALHPQSRTRARFRSKKPAN